MLTIVRTSATLAIRAARGDLAQRGAKIRHLLVASDALRRTSAEACESTSPIRLPRVLLRKTRRFDSLRNRPEAFARAIREIGGFELSNVPRAQALPKSRGSHLSFLFSITEANGLRHSAPHLFACRSMMSRLVRMVLSGIGARRRSRKDTVFARTRPSCSQVRMWTGPWSIGGHSAPRGSTPYASCGRSAPSL